MMRMDKKTVLNEHRSALEVNTKCNVPLYTVTVVI